MMKATWMRRCVTAAVICVLAVPAMVEARGFGTRRASSGYIDRNYYDPQWSGAPHSLIVPPNSRRSIEYQQGVGSAMNQRIGRGYPSGIEGPYQQSPTFPYSTNQMGVYYLRGPR
jgi:hypothetical protein